MEENKELRKKKPPCIQDQLIYDKGVNNISCGKTVSSINGAEKTKQPRVKE